MNSSHLPPHASHLTPHLIILMCLLAQAGCNRTQEPAIEFSGPTMGSHYSVQLPFPPDNPQQLDEGIRGILDEINLSMSTYLVDSELSRINAAVSSDWLPISPELYEVLSVSERISRQTDGAFDITVGPLVNLWGFGPDRREVPVPPAGQIAETLGYTGYERIELRPAPPALRKQDPRVYLDLSGIVPGYAADRVADFLDRRQITDYLVDISGEIRARGRNRHHEIWRVGIEKPLVDRRSVQRIVALADTGMTTAGDYRNFFIHQGRRYSHTIDPETGWPVAHDLSSVTVIDRSAMIADALDTAFMVMGAERALEFAESHRIAALFIREVNGDFVEQASSPFKPYMVE